MIKLFDKIEPDFHKNLQLLLKSKKFNCLSYAKKIIINNLYYNY